MWGDTLKGIIVGAGSFYGFVERPTGEDCVIAADGGYAVCLREGIVPRFVIGDFDSLGNVPETPNTIVVPVEKDDTDMMLAVKKGLSMGCREFQIYGGTGGRLDHTVANLQTLLYIARHGARGWLFDDRAAYTAVENGSLELPAREKGIFSLFAMDGKAQKVTVSGAQYSLENGTLAADFPLGVSNHFVGRRVKVSVEQGALLVCVIDYE